MKPTYQEPEWQVLDVSVQLATAESCKCIIKRLGAA